MAERPDHTVRRSALPDDASRRSALSDDGWSQRSVVDTPVGAVEGRRSAVGLKLLGIPYASADRFGPPAARPAWTGVREALEPGPAAPQPDRAVARFTHGPRPATDEHCLNLNVYTPSLDGHRPVMVWIHGGGFVIGHSGASIYDGARLAMAGDLVVVTVNYRLGSLGWLCHPALGAGDGAPVGNWGLLDQIAALEWVRDNIAAFGGDPGRVTVAGQSAGALSAIDLLAAPRAAGLFGRAILQSPPLGDLVQPSEVGERWAASLARRACDDDDPNRLRTIDAAAIVAQHEELLELPEWRGTRGGGLPVLDPGSLPASALEAPGLSPAVDVLIGSTADEGTFFFNSPWRPPPPPDRIPAIVAHLCPGEDPAEVVERYRGHGRGGDDTALLVAIATESMVAGPVARWASARAQAGARVYRYRFDHPGAGPALRATHTAEVPLVFGTWGDGGPGERLGGQGEETKAVAEHVVGAWASFVHGDPPGWRALGSSGAEREIGVFGGERPYGVQRMPETVTGG